MDDASTWNDRPAEERQEIEGAVQSTQGHIRSMLDFGNEFLRLLIDFTKETKDAFMTPEIVDRLAAMLDYNLDLLVGPRCTELKVKVCCARGVVLSRGSELISITSRIVAGPATHSL